MNLARIADEASVELKHTWANSLEIKSLFRTFERRAVLECIAWHLCHKKENRTLCPEGLLDKIVWLNQLLVHQLFRIQLFVFNWQASLRPSFAEPNLFLQVTPRDWTVNSKFMAVTKFLSIKCWSPTEKDSRILNLFLGWKSRRNLTACLAIAD